MMPQNSKRMCRVKCPFDLFMAFVYINSRFQITLHLNLKMITDKPKAGKVINKNENLDELKSFTPFLTVMMKSVEGGRSERKSRGTFSVRLATSSFNPFLWLYT